MNSIRRIFNSMLLKIYKRMLISANSEKKEKYISETRLKLSNKVKISETADIRLSGNGKGAINIGSFTSIYGEVVSMENGGEIDIGDDCFVGLNTRIWSNNRIKIGNRVQIAHNCNVIDNDVHPLNAEMRCKQLRLQQQGLSWEKIEVCSKEIIIDDDVLICANSCILKGVHIGKGAIIGTGSVVTRNIPAFAVAVGNPAEVKKYVD